MKNTEKSMDKLVALCKGRGFVYPGSEIYGGLANTWDYGPLGVELKNNIKKAWLKKFVQENKYNVGLDSAILMNPQTWVASGHLGGFSDPLMDCKECKTRHRADNLIEDFDGTNPAGWTNEQMTDYIKEKNIPCPNCGKHNFTDIRQFNLMFKTFQGVTEDSKAELYLRPETAQGIFVNFANIQRTSRKKVPFGVAQVGKSFRNEITPGNFIFRVREFEQAELEYFVAPGTDMEWHEKWKETRIQWWLDQGLVKEHMNIYKTPDDDLAHYAKACYDIEYQFPHGMEELEGIANRRDYDLGNHTKNQSEFQLEAHCHANPDSTTKLCIQDENGKWVIPFVIEPSMGVDRGVLAVLTEAYTEEDLGDGNSRVVLKLKKHLAPIKVAIIPLKKNNEQIMAKCHELKKQLMKLGIGRVALENTGNIGKAYRRHDEVGTPLCLTVDFETIEQQPESVTLRDRDTMEQIRVNTADLADYLRNYFL